MRTRRGKHILCVISPAIFLLATACGGGGDEAAKTFIDAVNKACAQGGGSVAANGSPNCDFQAVITDTPGAKIDSADKAAKTALDTQNSKVAEDCEKAAQLASVQCKFDKLAADKATCQKLASGIVQTVATQPPGDSGALFGLLITSAQNNTHGADCSDAFKNAYMTYMTALNGSLANSREGCAILEANLGKVLSSYQGTVSPADVLRLKQMSDSLNDSSPCPANSVMKMIYAQLSSSAAPTYTAPATPALPVRSLGLNPPGPPIPLRSTPTPPPGPVLRSFKDKNYYDFPVVY